MQKSKLRTLRSFLNPLLLYRKHNKSLKHKLKLSINVMNNQNELINKLKEEIDSNNNNRNEAIRLINNSKQYVINDGGNVDYNIINVLIKWIENLQNVIKELEKDEHTK